MNCRTAIPALAALSFSVLSLSCGAYQGPIAAPPAPSPADNLVISPVLRHTIGVPEGQPEVVSWTADGRMLYTVSLQNRTDKNLALRLRATFYDEAGVAVDEQLPRTDFLDKYEIKSFAFPASNRKAKKVKVQVIPAD
jgi:uncharacterized protein YcfL